MDFVLIMIPVILLVLTGMALRKFNVMDDNAAAGVNAFLFNAAIPSLLFVSIAEVPLNEILNFRFIISYLLIMFILLLTTLFVFRVILRRGLAESAMASFCSSVSNTALIALPILLGLFGNKATIPVAITTIVFLLTVIPFVTFLIEYDTQDKCKSGFQVLMTAVLKTVKNPFIISAVLGFLWSLTGLHLPKTIDMFFHYLGDATVPCALVIIGIGLFGIKFQGKVIEIIIVTLLNIVVKPMIAILFAFIMHMSVFYTVSLLVCCAVPTAKSAFIIAKNYGVYVQETAATVLLGSILTVATLPFYLWVCSHYWPSITHLMP